MHASQERLEALFSISTEISSTLQLDEVLQRVAAHACRLMDVRVSSLLLIDKEAGADFRTTVQQWKKHAPLALLHQCETVYEFDPRSGLRPLPENGSQA